MKIRIGKRINLYQLDNGGFSNQFHKLIHDHLISSKKGCGICSSFQDTFFNRLGYHTINQIIFSGSGRYLTKLIK